MTPPDAEKLSRREREAIRRREEILDAAEHVFSEKGYTSTTMEEVARRSEFGVGSLYNFFKNKEDLYAAMLSRRAEDFDGIIRAVFERQDLSPLERLERLFHTRLGLIWDYPRFFRVFFHHTAGINCDPRAGLTPEIQTLYEQFLASVARLVEEGMEAGEIRRGDPGLVVVVLEGIVRSYVGHLFRSAEPTRNRDDERALFSLFAGGIAASG